MRTTATTRFPDFVQSILRSFSSLRRSIADQPGNPPFCSSKRFHTSNRLPSRIYDLSLRKVNCATPINGKDTKALSQAGSLRWTTRAPSCRS
ncbi:unnamed protein product, partial [Ixodes persulcatus]